jgi:hypothetical protein
MADHRTRRRALRIGPWALAFALTAVAPPAEAAVTWGGGGGDSSREYSGVFANNGNGKFNKNNFAVNDPAFTRGYQNVFNQNIGGPNPTQVASCKRKLHHCKIVQRMGGWWP